MAQRLEGNVVATAVILVMHIVNLDPIDYLMMNILRHLHVWAIDEQCLDFSHRSNRLVAIIQEKQAIEVHTRLSWQQTGHL